MDTYKTLWQQKRVKQIVVLLGLLLASVIIYVIYLQVTFRVVATEPKMKDINILSPVVKVYFNKPITAKDLSVTSSENIIYTYEAEDKELKVVLNGPLQLKKSYTITINSVMSTSGKTIIKRSFTFVPKDIDPLNLTDEQENLLVSEQDKYQGASQDPIVSRLPYGSLNFSLSAVTTTDANRKSKLILQAKILLSNADKSDEATAIESYKKEVTDYISSIGYDPTKYEIQYVISAPYVRNDSDTTGD